MRWGFGTKEVTDHKKGEDNQKTESTVALVVGLLLKNEVTLLSITWFGYKYVCIFKSLPEGILILL